MENAILSKGCNTHNTQYKNNNNEVVPTLWLRGSVDSETDCTEPNTKHYVATLPRDIIVKSINIIRTGITQPLDAIKIDVTIGTNECIECVSTIGLTSTKPHSVCTDLCDCKLIEKESIVAVEFKDGMKYGKVTVLIEYINPNLVICKNDPIVLDPIKGFNDLCATSDTICCNEVDLCAEPPTLVVEAKPEVTINVTDEWKIPASKAEACGEPVEVTVSGTVLKNPTNINEWLEGTYTIVYTATNESGTDEYILTVHVIDTTSSEPPCAELPVILAPKIPTTTPCYPAKLFEYPNVTATACRENVKVIRYGEIPINPENTDAFIAGTYNLVYVATNEAGTSSYTYVITVIC